jgi:N-acetylglucosamine kinase-like BadF-type ATPase
MPNLAKHYNSDSCQLKLQSIFQLSSSPTQCRQTLFFRDIFPSHVKLFVENDAVAALASGTMGKLHGCVLIAGTGTIAYGFTSDGREARAAGAGPVLGDWGRLVKKEYVF